jgi:hypothetical protein
MPASQAGRRGFESRLPLHSRLYLEENALTQTRITLPAIAIGLASLAVFVRLAIAAQDRYALKVPNGLAFSEFRGYEDWQLVAPSQTDVLTAVELVEKDAKRFADSNGWGYAGLNTTQRPTPLRLTATAPGAGLHAINWRRQSTTFSRRTRIGERG